MITGRYPGLRLRRSRKNDWSRRLIEENNLTPNDFILPLFLIDGINKKQPIKSMPDVYRYSLDKIPQVIDKALKNKLPMIALFPHTRKKKKNLHGTEAFNEDNLVCKAIQMIKKRYKNNIGIMCDVALDPYTSHGHDGLLRSNYVLNDETIDVLIKQSLVQAQMGCDVLAPSDMMDGRIGEIRKSLDKNGYKMTQLLSYAVKYASSFYGPFRDAVGSKGLLTGNKKNLDIIKSVKENFKIPVMAYQVSGEYSLISNGIKNGIVDKGVVLESLIAFKRAGANAIVSYYADRISEILK